METRMITSVDVSILKCDEAVDSRFLVYLLSSSHYLDYMASECRGGTRDRVSRSFLGSVRLPNPPRTEQSWISAFLDYETGKIDALIEKQRRLIELLKEKRQAVISHAVTKGLNPNAPMKDSGAEWLGEIPAHWTVVRLTQLANIVRGGSPRPAGDPRFFGGDYMPWITVGEVTKDDEMYLTSTETMLTRDGANHSRRIDLGTLVLTNSGATLGVPKILQITGCANDGILAFIGLSARVRIEFLYWFLGSLTTDIRERAKQGSGQPNLNTGIVSAWIVGLPPISEQIAILSHIEAELRLGTELMEQAEGGVRLLEERRSALISAAVTGKIDVRTFVPPDVTELEEAYEPA
jgi:type I restriction enzyme S subunit